VVIKTSLDPLDLSNAAIIGIDALNSPTETA